MAPASFLTCFCMGVAFLAISNGSLQAQEASNGTQSLDLTFESFLEHPPEIASAICQETVDNSMLDPALSTNSVVTRQPNGTGPIHKLGKSQMQLITNSFTFLVKFKWDGTNYLMFQKMDSGPGQYRGRFNGVYWHGMVIPSGKPGAGRVPITLIDPQINPPGFRQQQIAKAMDNVNSFVNLGFPAIDPGSLVWDKDNHRFSASFHRFSGNAVSPQRATNNGSLIGVNITDSQQHGTMTAELKYENEVPVMAVVRQQVAGNDSEYTINYTYSPDFHLGRFPVEYTSGNHRVHYQELILVSGPIQKADFDPQVALKGKIAGQTFWSNGLTYYHNPSLGVLKMPTTEDYMAMLARQNRTAVIGRMAIFILLMCPAIYWFYASRKTKLHSNPKNKNK